jgi:hypothetical protein
VPSAAALARYCLALACARITISVTTIDNHYTVVTEIAVWGVRVPKKPRKFEKKKSIYL